MRYILLVMILIGLFLAQTLVASADEKTDYPRLANLWGMNFWSLPEMTPADYDAWARYDLLITAGGSVDQWKQLRAELDKRHPGIKLLQTAPLNNIEYDPPWLNTELYLRRPDGTRYRWWADQISIPNILLDECFEAIIAEIEKDAAPYVDSGLCNGLFFDSVVPALSFWGDTDANLDGVADGATLDEAWQARQNEVFARVRERFPGIVLMANDVDLNHGEQLKGRLFEGGTLFDRAAEGRLSVGEVVRALGKFEGAMRQPTTNFTLMSHPLGWQGWRVGLAAKSHRPGDVPLVLRDFRRMRLGLALSLMGDTFYAYDFGTTYYGLRTWYAEFDAPLGKPLAPAEKLYPFGKTPEKVVFEWQAGQPATGFRMDEFVQARRPEGLEVTITDSPPDQWHNPLSTDPVKVSLAPGKTYHVQVEALVPPQPRPAWAVTVRTPTGGWQHHDKGYHPLDYRTAEALTSGTSREWKVDTLVTLDDFSDYSVQWHLLANGTLTVTSLRISEAPEECWQRRFEGGRVLVNATAQPVTLALPRPLRKVKDDAAPRYTLQLDNNEAGFSCTGEWGWAAPEVSFLGTDFRTAEGQGKLAKWTFTAPSTDTYTLLS